MTTWIMSADSAIYDHEAAFERFGFIDWRQLNTFDEGDVVFIYVTIPSGCIKYLAHIEKTNLGPDQIVDDSEFWKVQPSPCERYARLKLVDVLPDQAIPLKDMRSMGISPPQGRASRIKDKEIIVKLMSFFRNPFGEVDGTWDYCEGAVERVLVNKFERNPIARARCIQHYGCKCKLCGFDFEATYGPIGKGFIEVHHIVPLNKIGHNYVVDPIKDLIPLCSNCHSMVHRPDQDIDKVRELLTR